MMLTCIVPMGYRTVLKLACFQHPRHKGCDAMICFIFPILFVGDPPSTFRLTAMTNFPPCSLRLVGRGAISAVAKMAAIKLASWASKSAACDRKPRRSISRPQVEQLPIELRTEPHEPFSIEYHTCIVPYRIRLRQGRNQSGSNSSQSSRSHSCPSARARTNDLPIAGCCLWIQSVDPDTVRVLDPDGVKTSVCPLK